MSVKIILCSQCGTKNRLPAEPCNSPVNCGSCGKVLAVGGSAGSNTGSFWLLLLLVSAVIAFVYLMNSGAENEPQYEVTTTPPSEDVVPSFSAPPVQISHGILSQSFGTGVAPLGIKTQAGHNYFVKVVEFGSDQAVLTAYVEGGRYFETTLPLGSYELRYASGEVWYGTDHHFGPETTYSKADQILNFTFDGYQYSGAMIELILQADGNLRTVDIDNSQF